MARENFSLIVPCYNEEKNVPLLAAELRETFSGAGVDWEVVYVDDGSTDGTYEAAARESESDQRFKVVRFSTNLGKSAAYMAGFDKASHDIICTMDGDLQDNPEDVLKLVDEVAKGADMAVGWKQTGKSDPVKWVVSMMMNFLIRICTGMRLHDMNCPLRAIRGDIARKLNLHGSLFRFIPIIVSNWTDRIAEVPVGNRSRIHGTSKYTFKKYPRALADFVTVIYLTTYEIRPLHFFGLIGLFCASLGAIIDIYVAALFFLNIESADENIPTFIMGIFLIFVGIQFVTSGLLGELIIHNFNRFMPLHRIHETPEPRGCGARKDLPSPGGDKGAKS